MGKRIPDERFHSFNPAKLMCPAAEYLNVENIDGLVEKFCGAFGGGIRNDVGTLPAARIAMKHTIEVEAENWFFHVR